MAESKIFRSVVYMLIFIFTGLSNLVPHTGSAVLVLMTLFGLPFCFSKQKRPEISGGEKAVMWALTAFFGVYFLFFVVNGLLGNLEDPRLKYLDHRIRLLSFIPILFLLKRIQIKEEILWYSVCLGAAVAGIYSIISIFWLLPGARVSGSYHSIAFGDLAIVMAFMSLVSIEFFIKKHRTYAVIPLAAFFLGTVASLLSGSKGAWIALPAFSVILFFFLGSRMKVWLRIGLCLFACILLFSAYRIPSTGIESRLSLIHI